MGKAHNYERLNKGADKNCSYLINSYLLYEYTCYNSQHELISGCTQAECTSGVSSQQQLRRSTTAATEVEIYDLLASESCYHSILVPC